MWQAGAAWFDSAHPNFMPVAAPARLKTRYGPQVGPYAQR
jgi:hypothetical protein